VEAAPSPLDKVIANDVLERRAIRKRSYVAEEHAMVEIWRVLAGSPRSVLQKLAEVVLALCRAQSAGVSLLEEEGSKHYFRWHAVAGAWGGLRWATLPRELSPCGTVLDREAPQLMIDPERYFTPLAQVPPHVNEALLVPFLVRGQLVGTVWAVSHEPARQFDREDRRVLAKVTTFAAAAYERLQSMTPKDLQELSHMHRGKLFGEAPKKPH
jgi:GAF domain-containing protein